MTPEIAAQVRALAKEGKDTAAIYIETGVPVRTIYSVLGRVPTVRELAAADRLAGWAPLCMDPDEWTDWQAMNPFTEANRERATRPCTDCPISFAADMRAEGKCNGTPGWRPPADDHEEADVGDVITINSVSISAPCGGCAHREVCGIRASLQGLDEADVTIPKPDPALTVGLAITVECSHFMRAKAGAGRPPKERTPAQLAVLETGRATLAANRAKTAADTAETA